ncbi:9d5ca51d-416a-468e-962a-d2e1f22f958d [Thermothielavioides terrestris]|uniref:9d5ca51d-416a-468e-962a-d2e1f22f958d n=1 Tax=Thermothielavioides terrestris TaxID=2587410 RepID=A0A446B6S6_9PEZI|nr:9d5ca51d-416a-468e-962a-d2e1f22f958d [Thermothielavioides terrestris]
MLSFLAAAWHLFCDVLQFWGHKSRTYLFSPSPVEVWSRALREATTYEEWREAAVKLDSLLGLDIWRNDPTSSDYDYRLIVERLRLISEAQKAGDVHALVNALRTGLVRNLGNITSPKLFNCCFSGTKVLIEDYVAHYVDAIEELAGLPPPAFGGSCSREALFQRQRGMAKAVMSAQHKLDFIHDTSQAFGRSALVLQGGAIFGLCHLGVVKALLLRGVLPRIIVGTATGAMMAALVGVHPEDELIRILNDDGIDVSAFASKGNDPEKHNERVRQSVWTQWATLLRRIRRFKREGYFLDVKVLEECVRANIGDLTFEEAYNRSRRVLNITVVTAGQRGIPTLLNYVTAPNVLVWTAAVASNASSSTFYGHRQTKILCKDAHGNITPWAPTDTDDFRHWTSGSYTDRNAPLQRVAGLFNVNHYIVSQARPYLIPFLQSDMHGPSAIGRRNRLTAVKVFAMRMLGLEVRHRLRQLDQLRLLPPSIRRFLVDEHLPGPSMTLVPQISLRDFPRLVETPTRETLAYWTLRGERSVWPAVAALRVRCAIEMELDRALQAVRRLKASDLRRRASEMSALREQLDAEANRGEKNRQGQL